MPEEFDLWVAQSDTALTYIYHGSDEKYVMRNIGYEMKKAGEDG